MGYASSIQSARGVSANSLANGIDSSHEQPHRKDPWLVTTRQEVLTSLTPKKGTVAGLALHVRFRPEPSFRANGLPCRASLYRAGVQGEVITRRWRNLLGRTMWEFASDARSERFLVSNCVARCVAHRL